MTYDTWGGSWGASWALFWTRDAGAAGGGDQPKPRLAALALRLGF